MIPSGLAVAMTMTCLCGADGHLFLLEGDALLVELRLLPVHVHQIHRDVSYLDG